MTELKEFTNKQLKALISDLYKSHNITIDENLQKQLSTSSKTQYKTLLKLYNEIKSFIESNISKSSDDNINNNNIELEKKNIEIQTDDIKDNIIYEEYKQLKTEIFQMKQIISNLKYKCSNYKKIIKEFNNKKIENNNLYSSSNNTDDENDIIIKERRKIKYHQLPELSSQNIINELNKLSKHQLKQLYNKYFSSKLHRLID